MSGDVALVAVSIALSVVALLAVACRSISRFAIAKQGGLEDGLVILALGCSITLAVLFTIGTSPGRRTRTMLRLVHRLFFDQRPQ